MRYVDPVDTAEDVATGADRYSRKAEGKDVREERSGTMRTVREEFSRYGRQAGEWMRAQGSALVCAQLNRAADEVDGLSEAGLAAAQKLHDSGDDYIAECTESIADNLSAAGRYLREKSVGEIYDDLDRFGRRRPELMIGGLFLGGLAVARFLRASRRGTFERKFDHDEHQRKALPPGRRQAEQRQPGWYGEGSGI